MRNIQQLIEEYAVDLRARGRSEHTIRWYTQKLRHFASYLKKRRRTIEGATRADLREFILMLQTTRADANNPFKGARNGTLSSATIRGYAQTIKGFTQWLVREEYLEKDPFRKVAVPKADRKELEIVGDGEMVELLRAAARSPSPARDTALVWTFYGTGIRLSELTGLHREAMHLSKSGAYIKVRGKGAKERLVPLGPKVQSELARYLREHAASEDGTVFLSRSGAPLTPTGVYQALARLGREAGVRISPHKLRHTFATNYLMNGGDAESLRLTLGHETLAMTMRYIHLTQRHLSIQNQRYSPADALWAKIRTGRGRVKEMD